VTGRSPNRAVGRFSFALGPARLVLRTRTEPDRDPGLGRPSPYSCGRPRRFGRPRRRSATEFDPPRWTIEALPRRKSSTGVDHQEPSRASERLAPTGAPCADRRFQAPRKRSRPFAAASRVRRPSVQAPRKRSRPFTAASEVRRPSVRASKSEPTVSRQVGVRRTAVQAPRNRSRRSTATSECADRRSRRFRKLSKTSPDRARAAPRSSGSSPVTPAAIRPARTPPSGVATPYSGRHPVAAVYLDGGVDRQRRCLRTTRTWPCFAAIPASRHRDRRRRAQRLR